MGAENWHDPHGILPERFRERYGDSETVADALRLAERQRSTTPDSKRPMCPKCGSLSVEQRTERSHQIKPDASAWKCRASGCWHHFDQPADETTIPMSDERTNPFEWIDDDDQHDADERTALDPPLAGIDREIAVVVALRLRKPWQDAEAPSYTEIARYLDFGDSWVGHRVREWLDGDHRGVVPDPSADPDPIAVDDAPAASSDAVATDGGRRRWDAYGSD